ncbi:hypothetical protein M422DRAFT_781919 [Sphaerobolus stellatus SS14]|uniref:Yeast cell wall synthesis Kre9/Knh1-like N-terminal domain-containing protein n=1 Tax=Sphaerobolus stellatus (strain SS14) TaxID=990650 RepID=A0A0C9U2K7_SPHS4|nr:hypothetical protein M422DRAFT_781919 [Sphaerobolus stellatus SS14]
MRSTFVALSILAGQAFAGVFMTNPTASTTAVGGTAFTINWQDDNKTPTLASIGPVEVGIFVGNVIQQTEVFQINASVDVSKVSSLSFTIPTTIGPNSNNYFVRMTSLALPSPEDAKFKYQSFSSKFQLCSHEHYYFPHLHHRCPNIYWRLQLNLQRCLQHHQRCHRYQG